MKSAKIYHLLVSFVLMIAVISCSGKQDEKPGQQSEDSNSKQALHVQITGEWLRTDGNYVLNIEKFNADSTLRAFYLNPKPIHIAETRWKVQDDHVFFFIKFDDEGYPGSYYSLGYLPEEDRLYGFYYQAVMNQEFEVIFERK